MSVFDVIVGIMAFVFIIGVIILVHEGGHYIFARKAGILAREFAFGMGPQLWKKKKGETVYSIRAFPIGGFCAIAGEEVEDDPFKDHPKVKLDIVNRIIKGFYFDLENEKNTFPTYEVVSYDIYDEQQTGRLFMVVKKDDQISEFTVDPKAMLFFPKTEYQIAPYNRTLGSKSKRARAMVMFGGPLMNFLLAFLAFFISGLITGFPNMESSEISGLIHEEGVVDSPAMIAGMENGDVITNLKSGDLEIEVNEWKDISEFMDSYTSDGKTTPITVTYLRKSTVKTAEVIPQISLYSIAALGQAVTAEGKLGVKILQIKNADDNGMMNNLQLLKDDTIIEINGKAIEDIEVFYNAFLEFDGSNKDEVIKMKVTRSGETNPVEISVKPYSKEVMDFQFSTSGVPIFKVMMQVSPSSKFNFFESIKYGFERTYINGTAVFKTLGMLFRRTVSITSLKSFIGIGELTVQVTKGGFTNLLNWMGLISVNVGVMNLLPIPALDGGRLLFLGYEAVTKKKPNPKVETSLITITMLLLFGLMIFASINDIMNLFK